MKPLRVFARGLPVKALFFSLGIHLVVLSVFIFTLPLSRVSFKPSFIFLGPILKQQDVGDIFQQGGKRDALLSFPQDPSGSGREDFFHPSESAGRRFIQGINRQPVSPGSVGTREKIVTKSFFDIPADVKQEQTGSVADPVEVDHEIAPYKPLRLFPRFPGEPGEPR